MVYNVLVPKLFASLFWRDVKPLKDAKSLLTSVDHLYYSTSIS